MAGCTQVWYFGLGPDTVSDVKANFGAEQGFAGLTLAFRPSTWFRIGGDVAYEDFKTKEGAGADPSIETIYDPITAPGLGSSPTYIHSQAEAAIDWRPSRRVRTLGRLLRRDVPRLHRSRRHVQLQPPRWGNHPAPSDTAGELGHLAAWSRADDARRRRHRAVLPAAVARQRHHAARLYDRRVFATGTAC